MLPTCPLRLPAIELTLSVRSFHVPATPFTFAWPPSLPSVPTSRATRVTSDANEPSWSTILLIVLAVRRNSPSSGRPSTSRAIVCERSPCATAPITRAVSDVGCTRSSISAFTQEIWSRQNPRTSLISARCLSLPSLPTFWRRRASSSAMRSLSSTTSLKVSASLPCMPVHSAGSRTELSPCRSEDIAASSCRASWALRTAPSVVVAGSAPLLLIVFVVMSVRPFLGSAQMALDGSNLVVDVAAQLLDGPLEPGLVQLSRFHQMQPARHGGQRRSQVVRQGAGDLARQPAAGGLPRSSKGGNRLAVGHDERRLAAVERPARLVPIHLHHAQPGAAQGLVRSLDAGGGAGHLPDGFGHLCKKLQSSIGRGFGTECRRRLTGKCFIQNPAVAGKSDNGHNDFHERPAAACIHCRRFAAGGGNADRADPRPRKSRRHRDRRHRGGHDRIDTPDETGRGGAGPATQVRHRDQRDPRGAREQGPRARAPHGHLEPRLAPDARRLPRARRGRLLRQGEGDRRARGAHLPAGAGTQLT